MDPLNQWPDGHLIMAASRGPLGNGTTTARLTFGYVNWRRVYRSPVSPVQNANSVRFCKTPPCNPERVHIQRSTCDLSAGVEKSTGGDGMRRRVIGATLTILGVLILFFEPVGGVTGCAAPTGGCYQRTYRLFFLISWPAGWWDRLALLQLIISAALVVTGIVLLIKARRSRRSPGTAR
jgi:hypothetical protein